jgi:hypothetical protein
MSYIILRGRWFHIIVLRVHAQTEDKTGDVKESVDKELERVFDKFPKYRLRSLLGDFIIKVDEEVYKPTIRNEGLREISNDTGVRVENFANLKI